MQNPHIHDIVHNTIDKGGFDACVYVRKDNSQRIKELQAEGYVRLHESEQSDVVLMGIPKKVKDTKKVKD